LFFRFYACRYFLPKTKVAYWKKAFDNPIADFWVIIADFVAKIHGRLSFQASEDSFQKSIFHFISELEVLN